MADSADSTCAPSAQTQPSIPVNVDRDAQRLHKYCRRAQAAYQLLLYTQSDDQQAEQATDAAKHDYYESRNRYWMHPVASAYDLAMKLDLFVQEEGHELVRAREYLAIFAADAQRVAYRESC